MPRPPGLGSVYQDKRGGWVAQIKVDERKYRARAATAEEAYTRLDELRRRHRLGVSTSGQTVGEYLEAWLRDAAAPRVRPLTFKSYEQKLRDYVIPVLGKRRLDRLTPAQVQSMLNGLTVAPRTVAQTRAILRAALGQAVRWGLLERNVAALTDAVRVDRSERQVPPPEAALRLLASYNGDRLEALYAVATLGLRKSEVLGLTWADIDLERGLLHVRRSLQRIDGAYRLEPVKSSRSRRTLPLPAFVAAALADWRVRQTAELDALPVARARELVFTTTGGNPINGSTLTHQFQRRALELKLGHVRFHDLRHLAATLLVGQGVDARTIMAVLGHASITTTADIYAHVPDARLEAAMHQLGNAWRPTVRPTTAPKTSRERQVKGRRQTRKPPRPRSSVDRAKDF